MYLRTLSRCMWALFALMVAGLFLFPAALAAEPEKVAEAIYADMEKAATRDDYIAVMKKLPSFPDFRSYEAFDLSGGQEIPFEKLTASQARESTLWYDTIRFCLCVSEDSVRYHNEVFLPRCQAFFRKFATRELVRKLKVTVTNDGRGITSLDLAGAVNPVFRAEKFGKAVLLLRPRDASFRGAKKGNKVDVEVSFYELPEAYWAFLKNHQISGSPGMRLSMQNASGKTVRTFDQIFPRSGGWYVDNDCYVVAGFSFDNNTIAGSMAVKYHYVFEAFAMPSSSGLSGTTVSYEAFPHQRGKKLAAPEWVGRAVAALPPPPAEEWPVEPAPAAESSKASETEGGADADAGQRTSTNGLYQVAVDLYMYFGRFMAPVLCLVFPWMLFVNMKERRRRYLPQTAGGAAGDTGQLHAEITAFSLNLPIRHVDGSPQRCYMSRKDVKEGYALLHKWAPHARAEDGSLELVENLGRELNRVQHRYMIGSWKMMGLVVFLFGGIAYLMYDAGHYLMSVAWAAFIAAYYLALQCPMYKLPNKAPWYCRWFQSLLLYAGVGSLLVAASIPSYREVTVYRDAAGNRYEKKGDRHDPGGTLFMILVIVMLVLMPVMFMINGLLNFFRNYVARS